jgi:two-component system response regulator
MLLVTHAPIMLVDDDANDLFVLQSRLVRAGVNNPTLTFRSGREAVDFLDRCFLKKDGTRQPGLLFLDLKLVGASGYDVLKWIRAQPELNDLPVVVLSGAMEQEAMDKAFELGADRFLVKHPEPDLLAAVVAQPRRNA